MSVRAVGDRLKQIKTLTGYAPSEPAQRCTSKLRCSAPACLTGQHHRFGQTGA